MNTEQRFIFYTHLINFKSFIDVGPFFIFSSIYQLPRVCHNQAFDFGHV